MTQAPEGKLGPCAVELHAYAPDSEQLKKRARGTGGACGQALPALAPRDSLLGADTAASLCLRGLVQISAAAVLT